MLNTVLTGAPTQHPPLLIVHGLFGSARNWGVIATRLSDSRQVLTVDMRNHGHSSHTATHSYPDLAADLAEVIEAHGGRADIVGHSMGGKAAMTLALTRPDRVGKLTVADIAPVAYTHDQRQLIHAMRRIDPAETITRGAADAALAPHIPDRATRAFLLQSLDLKNQSWRLNLNTLDAEMDRITGWPEDLTGPCEIPTLFLSGADSSYVLPDHRATIRALFPRARFARLPGAGHWLHADKPREFEASIRAWLAA